jgi:multisubunit Na+/H+ antiporter MnhB subunit
VHDTEGRDFFRRRAVGAGTDPIWGAPVLAAEQDRHVAQSAYDGWALLSVILIPAMLVNVALALMLRGEEGFGLAMAGCVCMAATLAVFFVFTYPANVATQNWKVAPSNWAELRHQWEYSHAANAGLIFASFCLIVLASVTALVPRR